VKNPNTQVSRAINTINITLDSSLQAIEKLFVDRNAFARKQSHENEIATLKLTSQCDKNLNYNDTNFTQQKKIESLEYQL